MELRLALVWTRSKVCFCQTYIDAHDHPNVCLVFDITADTKDFYRLSRMLEIIMSAGKVPGTHIDIGPAILLAPDFE